MGCREGGARGLLHPLGFTGSNACYTAYMQLLYNIHTFMHSELVSAKNLAAGNYTLGSCWLSSLALYASNTG